MKTIVAILLAMLIAISGSNAIDEEALLRDLTPDKESVATFIEDNFSLFVQKCNETSEDGSVWDATGIESKQLITVYTTDSTVEGLFFDFSEDDGYAILVDDYIMYDFQIEGDSPFMGKEAEELFYSVVIGYSYSKDGEVKSVNETPEKEVTEEAIDEEYEEDNICSSGNKDSNATVMSEYFISSKGRCDENGCKSDGTVVNPTAYVKSKYDEGYELYDSSSIIYDFNYTMNSLAVFNKNPNGGEGNCYWFSMYYALQYYADQIYNNGKSKMPNSSKVVNYDPKTSEPNTYNSIYNKNTGKNTTALVKKDGVKVHKYEVDSSVDSIPELWASIREAVDNRYKRTIIDGVNGLITKNAFVKVLNDVTDKYGVTIETDYCSNYLGLAITYIADVIKSNNMYIVYTYLDSVYETHSMAGCGYAIYRKVTTKWFAKITNYKYMLEVNTGWHTGYEANGRCANSRFYDASKLSLDAIRFLYAY